MLRCRKGRPCGFSLRLVLASFAVMTAAATASAQTTPVTATFGTTAPADDVNEDGADYKAFTSTTWIGTAASPSASLAGLRFANVGIPRGSIVQSARIEVYSVQTQWVTLSLTIGVEATGNAAVFSTDARPSQRSLASMQVAHQSNSQWLSDTWYSLDEIATLVQAVVDRSDWRSNNSLAFVLRGTKPTAWGRKYVRSFDGDPLHAPRLTVTFIPGGDGPPPPPAATGFQHSELIVGLSSPTSIAFTQDGRMLVTEDAGTVRVALPGRTIVEPTPFLSLTNIESIVGERALIGLALDPNFDANGDYYVFYTAQNPLRDRVSRFTAAGNATSLASEVVLWQDTLDSSDIHHGGGLVFGQDGKLYVSTGDGHDVNPGVTHASQLLTTYRGKVLRLNPDGTIPLDNPFHDGAGPNLDAIWARGLRNPFRMSVDSQTGVIHVYDVGGGAWEEVNVLQGGANYGWPLCEGPCATSGITGPVFAYPHSGLDAAIGGGVVYRGTAFPPEYYGSLFYGDYVQSWVRRLVFSPNGSVDQDQPFLPSDGSRFGPYGNVVDLEVGPDGFLYYPDIIGGAIHRVAYFTGNAPPEITSATATPSSGPVPLDVQFSGVATDADGDPLDYTWEFGDGATGAGASVQHTLAAPGVYVARLLVSDGAATTYSNPLTIRAGGIPTASITAPADATTFRAGDVITYEGSASDPIETLGPSAFSWSVVFHHDTHTHPAQGPVAGVAGGTFVVPTSGHDFSGNVSYEVRLTVTNSQGVSDTDSVSIQPQKVNLTVRSQPADLAVSLDQTTQSAPIVRDTLVLFQHRLTAALQQTVGGKVYEFTGWSDGGAATHDITAPANDTVYEATYREVVPSGSVTATLPLLAGNDDVNEVAGALQTSSSAVWLGTGGSATASYAGLRFANLPIPRASVIQTARLEVNAAANAWLSIQFELAAEAGPAAPFGAGALPSARVLTAARLPHSSNVPWTAGTWYAFDGLGPLVQAVVNGPSWSSGNALALIARGTGAGVWGRKFIASHDGDPSRSARLIVTYVAGDGEPPPPPTNDGRIDGVVFLDGNRNGVRDAGEGGLGGGSIALAGAAAATTSSDAGGGFAFANLSQGSYTVTMANHPGYSFTTPSSITATLGPNATVTFGVAPSGSGGTTLSVAVSAGSDDATEVNGQLALGSSLWVGNGGSVDASFVGLRFTGLVIPRGAAIVSARLEVTASATAWIAVAFEFAAEDADSAATFGAAARPSQRLLTATRTAHSSNTQWLAGATYALDDIAPVIQSVVDRAGWQPGGSLALVLRGKGATWGRKFIGTFEAAPASAARLVVVYQ